MFLAVPMVARGLAGLVSSNVVTSAVKNSKTSIADTLSNVGKLIDTGKEVLKTIQEQKETPKAKFGGKNNSFTIHRGMYDNEMILMKHITDKNAFLGEEMELYRFLQQLQQKRKPYYEFDLIAYLAVANFYGYRGKDFVLGNLTGFNDGKMLDVPVLDSFDARQLCHKKRIFSMSVVPWIGSIFFAHMMHEFLSKRYKRLVPRTSYDVEILPLKGDPDQAFFEKLFRNLHSRVHVYTAFLIDTCPCFVFLENGTVYMYVIDNKKDKLIESNLKTIMSRLTEMFKFDVSFFLLDGVPRGLNRYDRRGFKIAIAYFMIHLVFHHAKKIRTEKKKFEDLIQRSIHYIDLLKTSGVFEDVINNYIYSCLFNDMQRYDLTDFSQLTLTNFVSKILRNTVVPAFVVMNNFTYVPKFEPVSFPYTDTEALLNSFAVTFVPTVERESLSPAFYLNATPFIS